MPLDAPVMNSSGALTGRRSGRSDCGSSWRAPTCRQEDRAHTALEVERVREVVVLHAAGAHFGVALRDDDRQMRAHALGRKEGMQEFAAELDRLFAGIRLAHD